MLRLFKRSPAIAAPDTSALGRTALALGMPSGALIPPGCVGVAFDKGGRTRRIAQGGRIQLEAHESACCFHPGPYAADLLPFAAAPELGLRLGFAIDAPDPRVAQQRFDLYLMSEAGTGVALADMVAAIEGALQRALAQGNLELPPCTSLAEWNAFRAGLNQLLYTRFGLIVEDCIPVDLGANVDYAQILLARALRVPAPASMPAPDATPAALSDAQALRRLFLELPCVMCALRLAVLPPGQALFRQHQELLQRLDQVSLLVATMPALELAAPGQALAPDQQARRAAHSVAAVAALDEAWALLARLSLAGAGQLAALFDEADRIVANLEFHGSGRRAALQESGEA
ncbi:MAG: hypothetical protein V4631_07925 [Pseudomonadota bacterium]